MLRMPGDGERESYWELFGDLTFVAAFLQLEWIGADLSTAGIAHGFLHFSNFFLVWTQMHFCCTVLRGHDWFRKLGFATYICAVLLMGNSLSPTNHSAPVFDFEMNHKQYWVASVVARVPVVLLFVHGALLMPEAQRKASQSTTFASAISGLLLVIVLALGY